MATKINTITGGYIMYKKIIVLIILLAAVSGTLFGLKKTTPPEEDAVFDKYMTKYETLEKADDKIKLLNKAAKHVKSRYGQYTLLTHLLWYYAEQEEWAHCAETINKAHALNLVMPFDTEHNWPGYLKEFENIPELKQLVSKNEELKNKLAETSDSEYFITLPKEYDPAKEYSAVVFIQGGMRSNVDLVRDLALPESSEYIYVYYQSSAVRGSYACSHSAESLTDMPLLISMLKSDYKIGKIVLGGPSAGGMIAYYSSLRDDVPCSGLLLLFPALPESALERSGLLFEKNIRTAIISGENDRNASRHIRLAAELLNKKSPVRFLMLPGIGHEYPSDTVNIVLTSLEFLMGE